MVAERGFQQIDDNTGDRFIILKNGSRYEGIPGNADYRMIDFETLRHSCQAGTKSRGRFIPQGNAFW